MTLIPVDFIPAHKSGERNKLQKLLKDFANSDLRFVEVEFKEDEYKNLMSCYGSLHRAILRTKYPIKVAKRRDKIYLVKF